MIRLHHVPQSRSDRVLWLLHELGVAFDVRVWPFDKSMRSPEYRALNPAGRTPALEMDERSYWESGALIELLCERFSPEGLGRPPGHPERADWLIWVHFAETVSQHAAALTQSHVALREDWMRSPTVMRLEAARLGKCFDAVEAGLSGDWLLSGFSAADVALGQAAAMAARFAPVGDRPRMAAWLGRCRARPAWAAVAAMEGGVYDRDFYPAPPAQDPPGASPPDPRSGPGPSGGQADG